MKSKKNKTPEEHVLDIQNSCGELNWCIAMYEKDEGIHGLIIGNYNYIKEIVNQIDDGREYDIWIKPNINEQLH